MIADYKFPADFHSCIMKGKVEELENNRKNLESSPWELNCHLYDGAEDFFVYKNSDGTIAHISWLYYQDNPNRLIYLGKDECEVKYSLTFTQFRGKGIYPAILVKIQNYLKEKKCRRVFICVEKNNLSSIKGIGKAGFVYLKHITLIKIFGYHFNSKFSFSKE